MVFDTPKAALSSSLNGEGNRESTETPSSRLPAGEWLKQRRVKHVFWEGHAYFRVLTGDGESAKETC